LNKNPVIKIARKLIADKMAANANLSHMSREIVNPVKIFNIGKTAEPRIKYMVQPSKTNGKMRRSRMLRKKSLWREVSKSQPNLSELAQNDKFIIGKIPYQK
jgi:hypothetical protein